VKVIVDLCMVPVGVGVHRAPCIAACEKVLNEAGLKIQPHPAAPQLHRRGFAGGPILLLEMA
jgi:uncharacterized protein YqgV (UPF0045/DUF77 family)